MSWYINVPTKQGDAVFEQFEAPLGLLVVAVQQCGSHVRRGQLQANFPKQYVALLFDLMHIQTAVHPSDWDEATVSDVTGFVIQ